MKLLFLLSIVFILSGCQNNKLIDLFLSTKQLKCISIDNVEINGINQGDFVMCTKNEYNKRIK